MNDREIWCEYSHFSLIATSLQYRYIMIESFTYKVQSHDLCGFSFRKKNEKCDNADKLFLLLCDIFYF